MEATGGVLSPWFYLYLGLGACLPVASKRHPCGLKANSRDCFTFNTGTLNSVSTRPESTEPRSVKRMAFQDEPTRASDLKGRALYSEQNG